VKQTIDRLIAGLLVLFAITMAATGSAAQKSKQSPQDEFPFEQVGTVTKHGVDTCMKGINYDLHAADQKKTYWLTAVSKSDKATLDEASKDGSWVQVKGTMMISVEHCHWIAVSSVTAIKKSAQNKTMKKALIYQVDNVRITYIKKNPPEYQIEAKGKVRTGGWSNPDLTPVIYVHPPEDGIYDYHFNAEPPSGVATQAITPISATKTLEKIPKGFRGVRVRASSNKKEAVLGETR
jgi:hypothetical protein